MSNEYAFTPWINWHRRDELPALVAPGVYAIARTAENLAGKPFAWPRDIVYFGVSGALKSRLRQFDNTISRKRKEHGGADRVLYAYPDYSALTPELYVSILAVGETAAGDTAECWRRIGDARRLEYHCVAEHLERHGQLPQFNRGDSPKFSKIEPEA